MADFLTEAKTIGARSKQKDETEPLLKALSSSQTARQPARAPTSKSPSSFGIDKLETPQDVLQALKSQPSAEDLVRILRLLEQKHCDFDIRVPGPLQAQIINTLVTTIVPTFWSSLGKEERALLVISLCNVAGLNAVVARLRLLADSNSSPSVGESKVIELEDLLSLASALFRSDDLAFRVWSGLREAESNTTKRRLAWKEVVGLMASGKLVGTVARAEDVLKSSDRNTKTATWLSNGAENAAWLGRNVDRMLASMTASDMTDCSMAAADILGRAFTLGYSVQLVKGMMVSYMSRKCSDDNFDRHGLHLITKALAAFSRRSLVESILRWLSSGEEAASSDPGHVSAIASALNLFTPDDGVQAILSEILVDPPLLSTLSVSVRRACVVINATGKDGGEDQLQSMLERLMSTFSDQLFVDHAQIVQQEGVAQMLLLAAGYLHRKTPMAVLLTARSSSHMQGVSNRLDSSNSRARWLGMIVGTAMSQLVDKAGSKMNFGTEDMQTDEAKWYVGLTRIEDKIGSASDCLSLTNIKSKPKQQLHKPITQQLPIIDGKRAYGPEKPPALVQTEVIGEKVTEILDDHEDDDEDDLKPYAKPDSDPEDSDEDATLVNRNKPRAPVYIRDLMRMLKDDKDHDRFQSAVQTAPGLIRRKTNFGGEVRDHAEELALMLCDLQDPFETEDFDELKLQALIAVLLSDVKTMAPWLSKQVFAGDYSLQQRCIMLSALGLGGRELAGFKGTDELNPALPASTTSFPSKRLPDRLHAIYSPGDTSVRRLEAASKNIEHQLIKPLALSAADETTSHLNAVKVRTFSSRMEVERTKRKPAANQLAEMFGEAFFFPLVSRYQQELAAYGQGSVFVSAPFVLVTFLKTLALLFHASGPATMSLPEITTAFWELLLSLRVRAVSDVSVLEAILFSLLTLFEMNDGAKQRLVQETPKLLMETQQWVEVVFERTGGGNLVTDGSDQETRVRTLAAGVLVKTKEVIEGYQKLLIGQTNG